MFQFWKTRKNREMTSTDQPWLQSLTSLLNEPSLSFLSSTHWHVNQASTGTHNMHEKRSFSVSKNILKFLNLI